MTREIPYPRNCGCDDVVVTQEWSEKYNRWLDTGLRKISDQAPKPLDPPKPKKHDPLEGFEV